MEKTPAVNGNSTPQTLKFDPAGDTTRIEVGVAQPAAEASVSTVPDIRLSSTPPRGTTEVHRMHTTLH